MKDHEIPSIAVAARLLRRREISSVELTSALLDRIDEKEHVVHAFITQTRERALQDAAHADRQLREGKDLGPMLGIPVGLKDVIQTGGVLSTGGSGAFSGFVPRRDAAVAARLRKRGSVLMGKLHTHELAQGGPSFDLPWPPPRNPWDLDRFTGGSSSGSAAAVAAGFVLGAMGTDTGGSIRSPSALCGTVGLKPTYARLSTRGVFPNSLSLDTCGPMAGDVTDTAAMYAALSSTSADMEEAAYQDNLRASVRGLRIGVIRHFWERDYPVAGEIADALENAIGTFRQLGAVVEDVHMRPLQQYTDVRVCIGNSEIFSTYEPWLRSMPEKFGIQFLAKVFPGGLISAADLFTALRLRELMLEEFNAVHKKHDVLLTAMHAQTAPLLGGQKAIDYWKQVLFPAPFSITGAPAMSVRAGFDSAGLPIGMQLAAAPHREDILLRAAWHYEQACNWLQRRPEFRSGGPIAPVDPLEGSVAEGTAIERARILAGDHKLNFSDTYLNLVAGAAPYLAAMVDRVRKNAASVPYAHWLDGSHPS